MMKTKILAIAIMLAAIFTACEKDGDMYKVSGLESSVLSSGTDDVVLSIETVNDTVLVLEWTKDDLEISNPEIGISSSIPLMRLEVSSDNAFTEIYETSASDYKASFTGLALNTLVSNLGIEPTVSSPVYFRISARLGENTDPVYSNVKVVNVTSYKIDWSKIFLLTADKVETSSFLYSPNLDGEYAGFIGAAAWYNFYLKEGDGTIWGNYGADGYTFVADNSSSMWNFWYPGTSGCYYTTMSTKTKEWKAMLIPTLSITGDVEAEMTFLRNEVVWQASFTTTVANATFSINGVSALYDQTTGDAASVEGVVSFAPQGNNVVFNGTGTFTVPGEAGDYTLRINLVDPTNLTYEITSGAVVIVDPISQFLYLPGIDDGVSGSWTFENYLKLVSEDDSTFAGVVNVNSLWGYQMGLEADNWNDVYKKTSGDALSGTLGFQTGENFPAPEAGLYLMQADLKNLTYSLTSVGNVYYTGLNDDWTLSEMTPTETPGVYVSQVTISKASEWGMQVFIGSDWVHKFGGSDGVLSYGGANITDDKTLPLGTYTLIVDFVKGTYIFVGDQMFVSGLNDVWGFGVPLEKTSEGIYSGRLGINAATTYGYNLLLINDNWDLKLGGTEDALVFGGAAIESEWYNAFGDYNMTVDLINRKVIITSEMAE